jgi:FdhE protein
MDEDYLKHIDRLIRQRPAASPALRSYGQLAHIMVEVEPPHEPKRAAQERSALRNKDRLPFFSRDDLPVDFGAASALFKEFLRYLNKADRADRAGLAIALNQSDNDPQWAGRLCKTILQQDEKALNSMAEQVSLDPQVLLFLGKTALRPSFSGLRLLMEKMIDEEAWDHGCCPLCGSQPDMAYFTKTGKRRLHCELCGTQWAFSRIGCPFCNNEEQENLGYFEAEEEEGLRVYFCRSCQRYLKTIDSRVFEEVAPLELESLATLHLDVIAHENGFK